MPVKHTNWSAKVTAILKKEIKSEFRTRYAFNSLVMFSVVTLTILSLAVGQFALNASVKSALLWVVLFFSSMSGLAQVFIKEEERKTVSYLKLSAPPNLIFLGKFFFNLILLFIMEIITVPLYLILFEVRAQSWDLFLAVLFLGSVGLASATAIIAAIVSKTSLKGTLLTILSFPLLLPVLGISIQGTKVAVIGAPFDSGLAEIKFLIAYIVVMLTASLLLFETVWME